MNVFRISVEQYTKKLTASGFANRWNKKGEYVIYTSQSRSLATLELVVHRAALKPNLNYKVMLIEINAPKSQIKKIKFESLPQNWRSLSAYGQLQNIGAEWYAKKQQLILEIPSAVIPKESNFIINTTHQLFSSNVNLKSIEKLFLG